MPVLEVSLLVSLLTLLSFSLALVSFFPDVGAITNQSCLEDKIISIPLASDLPARSSVPGTSNTAYAISKQPSVKGESVYIDFSKKERICALSIETFNIEKSEHTFSIALPKPNKELTEIITDKLNGNVTKFYDFQDIFTKSLVISYGDDRARNQFGVKKIILYSYQPDNQTRSPATSGLPLLDDFENYAITNKTWQKVYPGQGFLGIIDSGDNKVYHMRPRLSTFKKDTHASLVESTRAFSDFNMSVDVRTDKQLRLNSPPNTWETAWVFFHYTDTFHYYWFLLKPNGIEMGKKDCDTCSNPIDGQIILFTASLPTLKIGEWSQWAINMTGKHIVVLIDGNIVIDYVDKSQTEKLAKGRFAMYNEDAEVSFDNFHVFGPT